MKNRQQQNRQQGFSLIELMVACVIIGILTSVVLPIYQDYTKKTQLAAVSAELSNAKKGFVVAIASGEEPSNDPDTVGWIGMEAGLTSKGGVCKIYVHPTYIHSGLTCIINKEPFKDDAIQLWYDHDSGKSWSCNINDLPSAYQKYVSVTPC